MSIRHRECWSAPRCPECAASEAARKRHVRRMAAYGRPSTTLIDVAPVRAHIHALLAAGMNLAQIGIAAGLDRHAAERAAYTAVRVRQTTAAAILAVKRPLRGWVPTTGTHRRLQALMYLGWTPRQLGLAVGTPYLDIPDLLRRKRTNLSTADRIRALDDRLWNTPPPQETGRQRHQVARMKALAAKHGWLPRLAWNDNEIDDPEAVPDTTRRPRLRPHILPRDADLIDLIDNIGLTHQDIAHRYKVLPASVVAAERHARARLDAHRAEEASAA